MKTISKLVWVMLFCLAASKLFGQNDPALGITARTDIHTFFKMIEDAGELTATFQSADGGFVTVSKLEDTSFLIRKTNVKGLRQWDRRLNYQIDKADALASINAISQTKDGGFVLAGQIGCSELPFECGPSAATLIKLRPNGAVEWKKAYTEIDGYFFTSVTLTSKGEVIGVGGLRPYYGDPRKNELLVAKFTSTGDLVWNKSYKSSPAVRILRSELALIRSISTSDGVIIAFTNGINPDKTSTGVVVTKLNNSGNVVWSRFLNAKDFIFQSMGTTADNGVFLFGTCITCTNKSFAIVLHPNGTFSWKAEYLFDVPITIKSVSNPIQTPDGGYVVTGHAVDNSRGLNLGFILKIDSSGKVLFLNSTGHSYSNGPEYVKSVFNTPDGGFIVFGQKFYFPKDIAILKLNSEGMSPGCVNYLEAEQFGTTKPTSFSDPLSITNTKIQESNQVSLQPFLFGLRSMTGNFPFASLCD